MSILIEEPTPSVAPCLTVTGATIARSIGFSERTLRRMVERGEFPRPFGAGKLRRWLRADVEKWLAEKVASVK